MSLFIISQILVGIAICTDILSFQFKEKTRIVACLLVSCVLISIHFMLLEHWTAACLGLLAATRFAASLFSTSKRLMGIFVLATLILAAVSYEGILSILACTGGIFGTVASFCKEDKQLRQLMLIATSLWLVHNVLAGSPGAVVMEALFIGSNLVGYFRYYIRPKKQVLYP
ncbi:MAG: membrane protein [Desulfobulbaceae bacterium BRH_c16a]|nr:MAG: membrane protein [Desulfobulbaceae bacterium BRH_c16a]